MLSIPEMKNLVTVSREFIDGDASFAQLNGAVSYCYNTSVVMGLDEQVQLLLLEYKELVDRTWNEWGLLEEPLPKDDLKNWIRNEFLDDSDENYQKFKVGNT